MRILILFFMVWTMNLKADLPSYDAPLVIVLLGPPGAGKGTHALPLSEKLKLPHISTGDLFRDHIQKKTPLGKKAQGFIDEGKLVPDDLVLDMLFSRIKQKDCEKGYILDGFPRSLMQAKALDKRLGNKVQLVVVNFNIADKLLVERITGRILCKECKASYHKVFSPPHKEGLCNHCQSPLYQRSDDTESVIKSRLEVYHKETAPLIDYYDIHNVLYDINSEKSQREVFEELSQTIDACLVSLHEENKKELASIEKHAD